MFYYFIYKFPLVQDSIVAMKFYIEHFHLK